MKTIKPGTRCECRDRTHQYDSTRPYARHNVGTCPQRAVRMVTVEHVHEWDEPVLIMVPMCAPCAEYHEARQKGTK